MKTFRDSKGESWNVEVNGGTIKRCLDLLSVDLGNPQHGDPPLLTRVDTDIAFMVDLLYVVCKPQADERGLGDYDFAARLEGDALFDANEAFMEEWGLFFQKFRRTFATKLIDKQRKIVAAGMTLAERTIESPAFDRAVSVKLAELGDSFASLLQSPERTPSGEPSES